MNLANSNSRRRPVRRTSRHIATLWFAATALLVAAVGAVPGDATSSVGAAPVDPIAAPIDGPASCCEPAVRLNPPQVPPSSAVGIVGDSLFVGITDRIYLGGPTLQELLEARGSTTWTAVRVGMTMPGGQSSLRYRPLNVAASDVIVIGLGTNDIHNSGGMARAAWNADIVSVVNEARAINPTVRVVWVDVAFRQIANRATAFNAELNALAPSLDIEVCAWHDEMTANPQWLAGDGLHLNSAGYRARRDIVERCIVG